MRHFCLVLILCLLSAQRAQAVDVFADFLYWKATEPVDWVLDTNNSSTDQFVTYKTINYNFAPGLRVGVGQQGEWDTKFYYTRFATHASDSASGDLTAAFMGGKFNQPPAPKLFFDTGQVAASINYNIFDWDLGKRFYPSDSLWVRPIVGLRGGWINQTFNSAFQAEYPGMISTVQQSVTEAMKNNFWGVGPKAGLETALNLWRGEEWEINCVANFYTAFLLGHWSVGDVTRATSTESGITTASSTYVPVPNRDFGALAFQAVLGFNLKYRSWSAMAGYEINDWLNQCQIFSNATGPQNNDLILQGLTVRVGYGY